MEYTLRVSSSVAPFREKAEKIWGLKRYKLRDMFKPVVMFGMYHIGDYFHYMIHLGRNEIFWAGSDIINLKKWPNRILRFWFRNVINYCENEVEQEELRSLGIEAEVRPSFLEDIDDFPVSFKPTNNPQVYLSSRPLREEEYGVEEIVSIAQRVSEITFHVYGVNFPNIGNVVFHGEVLNEQFNKEIRNYHAGLRLNEHDGFSEILAKSVLMGQYPISRIKYKGIDSYETEEELIRLLKELKNKTEPNLKAREFWRNNVNNYDFKR